MWITNNTSIHNFYNNGCISVLKIIFIWKPLKRKATTKKAITTDGLAAETGAYTRLPCTCIFSLTPTWKALQLIKPWRDKAEIYGRPSLAAKLNDLTNNKSSDNTRIADESWHLRFYFQITNGPNIQSSWYPAVGDWCTETKGGHNDHRPTSHWRIQ